MKPELSNYSTVELMEEVLARAKGPGAEQEPITAVMDTVGANVEAQPDPSIGVMSVNEDLIADSVEEASATIANRRAVRTDSQGDRVFLLDETTKKRHWITNPEVLAGLGFSGEDVEKIDDVELLKYQMAVAIYDASKFQQAE